MKSLMPFFRASVSCVTLIRVSVVVTEFAWIVMPCTTSVIVLPARLTGTPLTVACRLLAAFATGIVAPDGGLKSRLEKLPVAGGVLASVMRKPLASPVVPDCSTRRDPLLSVTMVALTSGTASVRVPASLAALAAEMALLTASRMFVRLDPVVASTATSTEAPAVAENVPKPPDHCPSSMRSVPVPTAAVAEAKGAVATDWARASWLTPTVKSPAAGEPETLADTAVLPAVSTFTGDQLVESLILSVAVCSASSRDLMLP